MTKKKKRQHFTFDSLIRLIIFLVLVYAAASYISFSIPNRTQNSSTTPDIPPILGAFIDTVATSSAFREISDKISPKIEEIKGLPQKEYDKFKDQLIEGILERLEKILRQ